MSDSESGSDYIPSEEEVETRGTKRTRSNANNATDSGEDSASESAGEESGTDDLWNDFLGDTASQPNPKLPAASKESTSATADKQSQSTIKNGSVSVTQKPEPESNSVTEKEDIIDSVPSSSTAVASESEDSGKAQALDMDKTEASEKSHKNVASLVKRLPSGGLASALKTIDKKKQISTVKKSKMDWDGFKAEKGLEEELETHNKGKDGFLNRQDFLDRADYRQFAVERDARARGRKK